MKNLKRFLLLIVAFVVLLSTCTLPSSAASRSSESMAQTLEGQWRGSFYLNLTPKSYANDVAVLNFVRSSDGDRLYVSVDSAEMTYVTLNKWSVDGDTLTFSYNQGHWKSDVSLSYQNANTLSGTYTQYGVDHPVTMTRVSSRGADLGQYSQFSYESEQTTYADWSKALADYPNHNAGGASIPFTYELSNRAPLEQLIKDTGLDARIAECTTDVERMTVLMDTVCDTFRHKGNSGMPEQQDVTSVMEYARQQGGIECRGLSIILSDLCRAYSIPAKSIKCSAADIYSKYCHVVVHAYSSEHHKWVMLDPSYRLILKDSEGNYIDLPALRAALISGAEVVPNDTAGHNHYPFYLEFYRAYMTKNTFHFSSATNFAFGTDSAAGNTVYTLTPLGYSYSYAYSRGETPVNDAAAFWKLPVASTPAA